MRQLACLLLLAGACTPVLGDNFLILPFFNLTKNPNLDWIGESVAVSVREALHAEGLLVIDREDRMVAYRRLSIRPSSHLTKASVIRLGSELDAAVVVYGSYHVSPPGDEAQQRRSLRITANVLDLGNMSRGPEYMELGALEDLARLQSHLAWETLQFLLPERAPSEEDFKSRTPVIRNEAIENYIRGLLAASPELKLKLMSQAVRLEPRYSQAHFHLGKINWEKKNWKQASDHLLRVLPHDSRYREANFLLGLCRYKLNDFAGAEQSFAFVAKQVPLGEVLNNLAAAQSRRRSPEALETFYKALDGDRNDPDYHFNVGYALYLRGSLADAAERFRAVLDRVPEDHQAMSMLGRCIKGASMKDRDYALEGMERLKENYDEGAYFQLKAVLEPRKAKNQ